MGIPINKSKQNSKTTQLALNVRLLVISLVALIVLVVGSFFWHRYQRQQLSDALLVRATNLEEEEEYAKSATYLYRYLEFKPDDNETRVRLAKVYGKGASRNSFSRAIKLYYAAVGVADVEQQVDLRKELIPMLLTLSRSLEANEESQVLLKAADSRLQSYNSEEVGDDEETAKQKVMAFRKDLAEAKDLVAQARYLSYLKTGDPNDPSSQDSRSLYEVCNVARKDNPEKLDLTMKSAFLLRSDDKSLYDPDKLKAEHPDETINAAWRNNTADKIVDEMVINIEEIFDSNKTKLEESKTPEDTHLQLAGAYRQLADAYRQRAEPYLQRFFYLVKTNRIDQAEDDILIALTSVNLGLAELVQMENSIEKAKAVEGADEDLEDFTEARNVSSKLKMIAEQVKMSFGQFALDEVQSGASLNILFGKPEEDAEKGTEITREEYLKRYVINPFREVQSLNQDNVAVFEGFATAFRLTGDFDSWVEECEKGFEKVGKDDITLNRIYCDALLTRGKSADVEKAEVALARLQDGLIAYSRDTSNSKEDVAPKFRSLRLLSARILTAKGDHLDALKEVDQAELEFPSEGRMRVGTLIFRGQIYRNAAMWDQAALEFEKAMLVDPQSLEARQLCGITWADAGQYDKAVEIYRPVQLRLTSPAIKVTYARLLFSQQVDRSKDKRNWEVFDSALMAAEQAMTTQEFAEPWQIDILKVQSEIFVREWRDLSKREGDAEGFGQLKKKLAQLESKYPTEKQIVRSLISIYEELEMASDADRLLAHYLKLDAQPIEKLFAQVDLLSQRQKLTQAKNLLRSEINNLSPADHPRVANKLIRLVKQTVDDSSSGTYAEIMSSLEGVEIDNVATLNSLAEQALEENDFAKVEDIVGQLKKIEGDDGSMWRFCQIRRLLAEKNEQNRAVAANLIEAERIQNELKQLRPNWSIPPLLLGLIRYEQALLNNEDRKMFEEARDAFKLAKSKGVKSLKFHQIYFEVLNKLAEYNEAVRLMNEMGERVNNSFELNALEIQANYNLKKIDVALELAKKSTERYPKDYNAWTNFGNLLRLNQKNDEALIAFNRALEIAPKKRDAWGQLFIHYVATEDLEKASVTLSQMAKILDLKDSEKAFLLAQGYEQLKRDRDAAIQYDNAIELAQNNLSYHRSRARFYLTRDISAAKTSLKKIIFELQLEGNESEKRQLAAILYRQGELGELRKLIDSFDKNSDKLRWNARLLADGDNPSARKEAIEIFEKAIEESAGGVEAYPIRFDLAKLYLLSSLDIELTEEEQKELLDESKIPSLLDQGDIDRLKKEAAEQVELTVKEREEWIVNEKKKWAVARKRKPLRDKAERELIRIVKVSDPAFEYVSFYVGFLIENEKFTNAEIELKKVDFMSTNGLQALILQGRLWQRQDEKEKNKGAKEKSSRFAKFETLVERIASKRQKEIEESNEYTRLEKERILPNWAIEIGRLYTLFKLHQAAEKWFRLGLSKPDGLAFLAYNLAEQGRADEAIDLLLEKKKKDDTTLPGVVIANLLAQYKVSPAKLKEARFAIDQILENNQGDTRLLIAVGDMYAVNKDVEAAVRYYENILKQDKRNVFVLNNLATLYSEIPGKRELALQHIQKAIQLSGRIPEWLDTEGMVYLYMGNKDEAIKRLEEAVSKRVDSRILFHLSVAYFENGEHKKAKKRLQDALGKDLESAILTGLDLEYLNKMKKQYEL